MRKNARIVQISGFRGIIFIVFVVVCLTAGFVVFPGLVGMSLWNSFIAKSFGVPEINIYQGILLWAIVAFSIYLSGGRSAVQFKKATQLNDTEIRDLMDKIKIRTQAAEINSMIIKSEELNAENKKKDTEETVSENKKENL